MQQASVLVGPPPAKVTAAAARRPGITTRYDPTLFDLWSDLEHHRHLDSGAADLTSLAPNAPAADARASGVYAEQRRPRRITFIRWLRKIHGWIGLWGAALGLLFGTTGFFLNHRAGPLRISTGAPQVAELQMPLPQPAPASPRELGAWLKGELKLAGRLGRVQKEAAHAVAWGDRSAVQPEHWQLTFASPQQVTSADYWVGSGYVTVKRTGNTFLATLTNLHKGVGLSVGWVLLIDTLAGSIILLSLTGVLLWTQLNTRRTLGAVLVIGSIVAAVCVGLA